MSKPHRPFKDAIYEQLARLGKALSAPKRLELLELLGQAPRTVEALGDQAGISVANASQHLQVLRAARLVAAERKGLYIEYRLADAEVARCIVGLRRLAEGRLAEVAVAVQAHLGAGGVDAVTGDELLRRLERGDVTVVDVRPAEEYRAGHLPGAHSIPVSELVARLAELPRDREVVAYCRGPYCLMAVEAVEALRRAGYRARRMEEGVLDWRHRGWALAAGDEPSPSASPGGHR